MSQTTRSDDESFHALFHAVRHLHFHLSVRQLEKLGFHIGQPPVLRALWQADGQTQAELARDSHRTPATLTVILQKMEQSGWITRRPDPNDLRVTRVFLTEKSRQIRPQVEAELRMIDEQTFQGFTDTEQALLRRFFLQMRDNLKTIEQPGEKPKE